MTEFAPPPGYHLIEDRIDEIGQKYRGQRIVRGTMIFAGGAIVSSLAAALLAHFLGASLWTHAVLALWAAWLAVSAYRWLARPLFIRPDAIEVARFIESRIDGLHNGLTNGLLLARRPDISQNPWLPEIYQEIVSSTSSRPLGEAVKMRDLSPLALRLLAVAGPLLLLAMILPRPFLHGWSQMFHPAAFVPKLGAASIIDVQPKDVTIVAGQPLEITMVARCPGMPGAKLIFGKSADAPEAVLPQGAELTPTTLADPSAAGASAGGGAELQYNYHVDHVDAGARYRVEVAGTQTPWYTITVVKKVSLQDLELRIVAPAYTHQEPKTLVIKSADVARVPVVVPQGSKIELAATVDIPVGGAMLQASPAADAAPQPMDASEEGKRFTGSFTVNDDVPVTVLLTQGGHQVIARLPDDALVIHCTKDAKPTIEMKWPTQDVSVAPAQEIKVIAMLKDDYGIASARVLLGTEQLPKGDDAAGSKGSAPEGQAPVLDAVHVQQFPEGAGVASPVEFSFVIPIKPELRKHGNSIRVQVEATDNRALPAGPNGSADPAASGPQTSQSSVFEITFRDPEQIAKEDLEKQDKLREKLTEMLKKQQSLLEQTIGAGPDNKDALKLVNAGQTDLRILMQTTAESFPFEPADRNVQKTLLMLTMNTAKDAVDFSSSIQTEPVAPERVKLHTELQARQRRVILTLESLLALLSASAEPATQPSDKDHNDLLSQADKFKKADEALKKFMKEEQRILDQTASLSKKPVDKWDDNDKAKLDELKMAQEKMDAFMQQAVSDFSKNAEQDQSNAALLKDMLATYSEVTMAKDALKAKAAEIAVAAEDAGLEGAKEISSNIEKWLSNTPDRAAWKMEDPTGKNDTPMPELPKELEDMVGELMEQQEDLFDQMEDANANWHDSADKGIGWDAADGPIADMSAKGVTGNQLPNNNEMDGRSGEGRQGKSQGEFVGDTAVGKGGRNTPTRLDPTAFAKGQIKDESKDPTGGATGGGKLSGQGGHGLEGPVPPKVKQQMQRLAQKEAELHNKAEKLNLQYKLGRYDNFKLLESEALMRRVETDLNANRYQNAMRHKDVLLDSLDTSRLLLGGEVHVQKDTSPTTSRKLHEQIDDAMKGELPPAWSDALKEYYQKLSQQ